MSFARAHDPVTSHEAAASVRGVNDKRAAVLEALRRCGPATDDQLFAYYEAHPDAHWPWQSDSGMRTRRCELVRLGLVRDSGMREHTPSGRRAIAWEAVPGTSVAQGKEQKSEQQP